MLVGREIGPFIVEKEIGAGAMGAVFRGRHKQTGKKVAIKLIAPGLTTNRQAMERFKREITILKQLEHPNIVKLLASGKLHGTPFYVMEFIEGESLDSAMERRGRLTWEELVPLGQQLCSALQYAHDKGIIHRDLKPSNLMILKDGTVKLTDFGIAKDTDLTALTAANSTVGTAAYMSPEQCRGVRDLTAKSDLYSMGIMFYELVTGRKPFVGESAMEVFTQHLTGKFERPSRLSLEVPIWLDTLICQLMEKDPEKRPFSAETVSQSLGMIKEKVEAQRSAGMEAATKRRVDRGALDVNLDEADLNAARVLLGKKKKKKKTIPFYQKGSFTIAAVSVVLLLLAFGFYWAFLKPDSPETLYSRAEALMASADIQDRREARKEPIAQFLQLYPNHEKAEQIQKWADQQDLEDCEIFLAANWNKSPMSKEEERARDAIGNENLGKLDKAAQQWEGLKAHKASSDPIDRGWGLLAEKRLAELDAVADLLANLQQKRDRELKLSIADVGKSEQETMALDALRKEEVDQQAAAWNELKMATKDRENERRWFLLAAKMERDLSEKKKDQP